MNAAHPAPLTPSWHGDLVGHYEGDTLVIDTVGQKTDRPFAMVDLYGTPYTEKLHIVERYRLLDYEDAKEGLARDANENFIVQVGQRPRITAANSSRSNSRSRMTASSPRRGPRRSPTDAAAAMRTGWKSSAPKIGTSITTTRNPRCRRRIGRIFKVGRGGACATSGLNDAAPHISRIEMRRARAAASSRASKLASSIC